MVETSSCQFADVIVAAPVGRVDHHSVGELEAALMPLVKDASDSKGMLVLDFAGIDYISSVGLRILMIAAKELRAAGAKVAGANLKPVVGGVFGTWTSSMIGVSTPSKRLERFTPEIEKGKILLMVDVPLWRVEKVEARLRELHPEAHLEGTEPDIPAFP